jgi:transketolase
MRKEFAQLLFDKMNQDSDIYLITADLGYGLWDNIKDNFPDRFFNVGSSEMLGLGACVGLAMEGKKPFFYSITPFSLYRPFEIIRNYLDYEEIAVTVIGGGRDKDYGYLGFTHWGVDDRKIMSCFKNIRTIHPETLDELKRDFESIFLKKAPTYINLRK